MKSNTRKAAAEIARAETLTALRTTLQRGTTVYTILRHVSATGMCRWLDLYVIECNRPLRITWSVAQALEGSYDRKREALKVEGAGMDMGFDTVYSLGMVLFRDGNALQHRWL